MFSVGSAAFAMASGRLWAFAQKGSKRLETRKKAQKGSKRHSKRLFEPVRCRQCARRGCSSLLRCRLCVRKGFSSLLFKITIRKCCTRLTLCSAPLCSALLAPCMYMHGSTLVCIRLDVLYMCVYICIHIYVYVCMCVCVCVCERERERERGTMAPTGVCMCMYVCVCVCVCVHSVYI